MNNRTIILICLIILIAGVTNWLLDQSVTETAPALPGDNDPDLYMANAEIVSYDESGQIQHRIKASRFTHFPANDVTVLKDPDLDLLTGEAWNIAARHGQLLPKPAHPEQMVEFWEHVVATRESPDGGFTNIQTERLSVFPDRDYAETDETVYIDNPSGRTSAAAMKAWFDPGRYQFFSDAGERVNTTLLPDSLRE
ncbi:MAG: LPS export ABC transporter periplasmic protein LptC [Pseudomonadales bacterium]|nr:LPS export ABC transporter periplasmic protein LptC [Pseudomonadales bacterium]